MKNMRNLIILTVFAFISTATMGQMSSDFVKGNEILEKNNKQLDCYSYVPTSNGIYIGSRSKDGSPINFLYRDGRLSYVPELQSYVVLGYSANKNFLFVGLHSSKPFGDTMCKDFFTYDLVTHKFKKQVGFRSEVYRVTFKNDTLYCGVNTKMPDGIGSEIVKYKKAIN